MAGGQSRAGVRLLGRLLGEVIREQHGQGPYRQVEDLRRRSVGEHIRGQDDEGLRAGLAKTAYPDMLVLIRAFSIFSQLANIADDQAARREARDEGGRPLERLMETGRALDPDAVRAFLKGALLAPVITAHPTEVRRKSVLDREAAIAALLDAHEARGTRARGRERIEAAIKREIRILWQTRMLRPARLQVTDEIDNAVSIFARTFLRQVPALKRRLSEATGLAGACRLVRGCGLAGLPSVQDAGRPPSGDPRGPQDPPVGDQFHRQSGGGGRLHLGRRIADHRPDERRSSPGGPPA